MIPKFTEGWKRNPPLYGPIAELNWTRYPVLTCTCPLSSVHGTRNLNCLSGFVNLSRSASFLNSSSFSSITTLKDSNTSRTAWWNSGSEGFCSIIVSITSSTYDKIIPPILTIKLIIFDTTIIFMYFLIFNSFHFFKKKSNIINYINKFIGQTLNKIKKI